jgi:hypothetical protein
VLVDERFDGEPVWQGEVLVFNITGDPSAIQYSPGNSMARSPAS